MRLKKGYILPLLLLPMAGCGKKSTIIAPQQTAIVNYLNGLRMPDGTPRPWAQQGGAYQLITNIDRAGRDTLPAAEGGDEISFHFALTLNTRPVITSSIADNVTAANLIYTNIADLITKLIASNPAFDPQYWSTEPENVRLGSSPLVGGLADGLAGCRTGDMAYIFLTSDQAFGTKGLGVVPRNTPVAYYIVMDTVIKQQ